MQNFYVLTMLCAGFNRTERNVSDVNAIGTLMNTVQHTAFEVAVTKVLPSSLDSEKRVIHCRSGQTALKLLYN
ncbi:hypothetical protein Osc1_22330 [Hominimerdicola sp. 21CYCFAH17_S]